jgi:hypothetical protein
MSDKAVGEEEAMTTGQSIVPAARAVKTGSGERRFSSDDERLLRYMRPLSTTVTWRDWGSQLDRLKLVQEKPPVAGYQHVRICTNERAEVKLMAGGRSKTSDSVLLFEIVREPEYGQLDLTKLHTHHILAYTAFRGTAWDLMVREADKKKQELSKIASAIADRDGLSQLESMFQEFDADSSGELDVDEFTAALERFGAQLKRKEVWPSPCSPGLRTCSTRSSVLTNCIFSFSLFR